MSDFIDRLDEDRQDEVASDPWQAALSALAENGWSDVTVRDDKWEGHFVRGIDGVWYRRIDNEGEA